MKPFILAVVIAAVFQQHGCDQASQTAIKGAQPRPPIHAWEKRRPDNGSRLPQDGATYRKFLVRPKSHPLMVVL